jgi:hypothetical protein
LYKYGGFVSMTGRTHYDLMCILHLFFLKIHGAFFAGLARKKPGFAGLRYRSGPFGTNAPPIPCAEEGLRPRTPAGDAEKCLKTPTKCLYALALITRFFS